MNIESKLLTEIWTTIEDHVPKGQRVHVAMAMFRAFEEFGIDVKDFAEAAEEDNYLEAAFKSLVDDEIEFDRDYEDE